MVFLNKFKEFFVATLNQQVVKYLLLGKRDKDSNDKRYGLINN